ncbi:hypothetical protein BSL78_00136 [Apostichopus japonicus]|uniref:Uncharacterized protein n=1 Tax=Stichopus japonicus TaxID=307972 RepID=A0A2G8LRP8_STIJA|nr:hypothetical protein BSL78_00136 [Apostichopus japonicus]
MENKRNEKTHFCALCKQSWTSLPDYGVHLISRYHKNAALKRLQILKNANLEPKIPNRQSNSFQFREPIERISSRNDERKSSVKDSAISMSERTPLSSSSESRISPETPLSETFREISRDRLSSKELRTEFPPSIRACRWEGSNDVFRQRFPEDKLTSWREERRAAHLSRPIPREKNFGSSSTLRKPERFNDHDFAMEGMTLFENRSSFDSDRFCGRGFSNDGPSPFALEGREHELRRNYEDSVNPEIDRLPQRTEISNSYCHTDLPNVETEYSDRQKWPSTRQNAISNRQRETPNRQKL